MPQRLRRHLVLFALVEIGWGIGFACYHHNTVIPAFLHIWGVRQDIAGLVPALFFFGIAAPQLLVGYFTAHHPRKKPAVLATHCATPIPLALYGLWLLSRPAGSLDAQTALVPFFFAYGLYLLLLGLTIPLYFAFVERVVPEGTVGRALGVIFALQSIAGAFGGLVAERLHASAIPFPHNYAWGFIAQFVVIQLGNLFFLPMREVPGEPADREGLAAYLRRAVRRFRAEPALRTYVLYRSLQSSRLLVAFFFTAYALDLGALSDAEATGLTASLLVGGAGGPLIFGPIADRRGPRVVALFAQIAGLAAIPVLLAAPAIGGRVPFHAAAFLLGLALSADLLSHYAISLSLAGKEDATMTLGIIEAAGAPALVGLSLAGGFLVRAFGFRPVAAAAGGIVLLGVWVLVRYVRPGPPRGR